MKKIHLFVEELESRLVPSTYYLSPTGNDTNTGTDPSTPWQTLAHVNGTVLQPGDQVLLQGGAAFSGPLLLGNRAGTSASPIVISSYGVGNATIDAGLGNAINATNASWITISNLILVGSGYSTNTGNGIYFFDNQPGVTDNGVNINNVDVSGFGQIGIYVLARQGGIWNNVSITHSSAHDNGYGGVLVDTRNLAGQYYSHSVYVGHVQAYHNAGASITLSGYGIHFIGVSGGVIERSVSYDNGWLPGNGGATGGISALICDHILLQYNESYDNHTGKSDGDGVILDATTNSVMQYNYSHDNDGTGLFLGAEIGLSSNGNTIRYNISQNDARTRLGGILIWENVSNNDIYNNTIFVSPSSSSPSAVMFLNFSGSSMHLRNNIFITTGGVPLITYAGGGTDILFQGNDYYSSGSKFTISWLGTTYNSVKFWRKATGQEEINGSFIGGGNGYQFNPQLVSPGNGGTIGNADLLNTLTAYQLQNTSPLLADGLNLSQFGVLWDAYGFGNDPFLSQYFRIIPQDFYGNVLPSGNPSVGAYQ
jgi:hypothetical protein